MTERCFACGKILSGKTYVVMTEDGGQLPWVGPDCYKQVKAAGDKGWAPTNKHGKGGPRLFLPPSSAGSKAVVDATFKRALGVRCEMTEDRKMDRAYAELSLRAGWFAAGADQHLGGLYFANKIRAKRWDLTPEWFESVKQEALALGVPQEIVESSPMELHRDEFEALFAIVGVSDEPR